MKHPHFISTSLPSLTLELALQRNDNQLRTSHIVSNVLLYYYKQANGIRGEALGDFELSCS